MAMLNNQMVNIIFSIIIYYNSIYSNNTNTIIILLYYVRSYYKSCLMSEIFDRSIPRLARRALANLQLQKLPQVWADFELARCVFFGAWQHGMAPTMGKNQWIVMVAIMGHNEILTHCVYIYMYVYISKQLVCIYIYTIYKYLQYKYTYVWIQWTPHFH